MRNEVIIFDLDNCILLDPETGEGSDEVKQAVWLKIFPAERPENITNALCEALNDFGGGKGDRNQIAERLCELFPAGDPAIVAEQYSLLVDEALRRFRLPDTVQPVLRNLANSKRLFVNTGTPANAARSLIKHFGLEDIFEGVYGRPATKLANLAAIADFVGVMPTEMIYVGDLPADAKVAKEFGCQFIGVETRAVPGWQVPQSFATIRSIAALELLL